MKKIKKYFYLLMVFGLFLGKKILAADSPATTANLQNPLGSNALTPQELSGRIISSMLGIVGSIALIMFVVGGFYWLTAGGNEERIKKGRQTLEWAAFGLIVIFGAYVILKFVFQALTKTV